MSTKELLKKYSQAFDSVMDESNCQRYRYGEALRASTLAEIMRDQERLVLAAKAVEHFGQKARFEDGK